jgi:hypothetical protein
LQGCEEEIEPVLVLMDYNKNFLKLQAKTEAKELIVEMSSSHSNATFSPNHQE